MRTALLRWVLVVLVSGALTGVAAYAPTALRRMDSFHVQQVEVTGARYLSPQEAVAATGISPTSSVFDDFAPWRAALLRQPLVRAVEISRRLPFTIVLHVTETTPVAFAALPELRPVDARGRLLEIDPTRVAIDLPLLAAPTGKLTAAALTDRAALRTLAALGKLAELEPALFALTSEASPLRGGVRLTLRDPAGANLLLPDSLDAARLHLARLALADVRDARPDTAGAGARLQLRRIDARYGEQIVVALTQNESR